VFAALGATEALCLPRSERRSAADRTARSARALQCGADITQRELVQATGHLLFLPRLEELFRCL